MMFIFFLPPGNAIMLMDIHYGTKFTTNLSICTLFATMPFSNVFFEHASPTTICVVFFLLGLSLDLLVVGGPEHEAGVAGVTRVEVRALAHGHHAGRAWKPPRQGGGSE